MKPSNTSQSSQSAVPAKVVFFEEEADYENDLRRELREASWRHAAPRPGGSISRGSLDSECQYEGANSFEFCLEIMIP